MPLADDVYVRETQGKKKKEETQYEVARSEERAGEANSSDWRPFVSNYLEGSRLAIDLRSCRLFKNGILYFSALLPLLQLTQILCRDTAPVVMSRPYSGTGSSSLCLGDHSNDLSPFDLVPGRNMVNAGKVSTVRAGYLRQGAGDILRQTGEN